MLDNLFAFIGPGDDTLFDFINQIEVFFDVMEEKGALPAQIQRPLSEDTYREMWMLRYQQHLGNFSFLDLLDKYEEILGISPQAET